MTHDELLVLLAAKDAEIAARDVQHAELQVRIEHLKALLRKDSSNSGKPPSSDSPFEKKPAAKRSSRSQSGRGPGKQSAAGSSTLRQVADPDMVVPCPPSRCSV